VGNKFGRILIVSICIACFALAGVAFAQKDVKYDGGTAGAVLFGHAYHKGKDLKCTDCHTKIFSRKKEAKITKAEHNGDKLCAACHDGKKTFGMKAEADCAKCHKK